MGPGIMFVPVPVFAIIVLYVGLFALGVWVWWVVLYPLFWLIGTERVRQVHFWVANGAAFLNLVPPLAGAYIWPFVAPYVLQFVAFLVILQRTPRWVVPILSAVARIANETTLDQKETKPANKSESEGPPVVPSPMEEQERKEVSKFRIFAWITAGFAVFLPAGALRNSLVPAATRDVTRSAGRNELQVLLFSGVGTLGLAAFFLFVGSVEYMSHANAGTQLLVTSLNISIVTALFASAVWWYSTTLYPRMPAALGGGKPETVAVWLDAKALPLEVRTLGGADCTAEAPIVRCRLQLIYRNDKDVILAAPGDGRRAAVLVPRDTIKAVSW